MTANQIAGEVEKTILARFTYSGGELAKIKTRAGLPSAVILEAANRIAEGFSGSAADRSAAAWVATKRVLAARRDTIAEAVKDWPEGRANLARFADANETATEEPEGPGFSDLIPRPGDIAEGVSNALGDVRKTAITVAVVVGLVVVAGYLIPKLKDSKNAAA